MDATTFNYVALGQRLRKMREDAGLTQDELAARIGMGGANVNHIEHHRGERRIHLEDLFRWSAACGRPLTLVWGDEPLKGADLDVALRMPRGPLERRKGRARDRDAIDPTCDLTRLYGVR